MEEADGSPEVVAVFEKALFCRLDASGKKSLPPSCLQITL